MRYSQLRFARCYMHYLRIVSDAKAQSDTAGWRCAGVRRYKRRCRAYSGCTPTSGLATDTSRNSGRRSAPLLERGARTQHSGAR